MRLAVFAAAATAASLGIATPAFSQEVFAGVYAHGVETPLTFETNEGGTDLQLGYRFAPVGSLLEIEPYIIGSLNTDGDTSFVGVGVSRKFDLGPIYVRPGVGVVVHDGPDLRFDPATGDRTDLGSRVLFEPEIAVGTRLIGNLSVEASWVHISHAQIFNGEQNPGIDMMGVRVNLGF